MDELGVQLVGALQEALPGLGVDQGQDRMEKIISELRRLQSVCHPYIHLATQLCGVISHHL